MNDMDMRGCSNEAAWAIVGCCNSFVLSINAILVTLRGVESFLSADPPTQRSIFPTVPGMT